MGKADNAEKTAISMILLIKNSVLNIPEENIPERSLRITKKNPHSEVSLKSTLWCNTYEVCISRNAFLKYLKFRSKGDKPAAKNLAPHIQTPYFSHHQSERGEPVRLRSTSISQ